MVIVRNSLFNIGTMSGTLSIYLHSQVSEMFVKSREEYFGTSLNLQSNDAKNVTKRKKS